MHHSSSLKNSGQMRKARQSGAGSLPVHPPSLGTRPITLTDESPSLLLEYWRMLRRHKVTLLLAACLGLLLGVSLTILQTPVYEARTTLEIQNPNENFLNMRDVNPTSEQQSAQAVDLDLQTQINIVQSESVLRRVIHALDLSGKLESKKKKSHSSAWLRFLGLGVSAPALTDEDVLHRVASNLKVHILPETRLVEILYDSTDPRLAANVANSLSAAYIQQNLESHRQIAKQTDESLTRQTDDVRIKLEESEQALQAYAGAAGLLFTSEKDNIADAKLRQVQEDLSKAQADRVAWQSRYERVAVASPDSLPEVLGDPTLKDYQVKLTDLRRQLAEFSASLTPLHPSVKKIQAEVAALETAREAERNNITRSIQNQFESARQREKLLAARYDAQARLVMDQAGKATRYDILKREVDNNRQLYDSMLQHVREAGITSALHASNIRVVDAAVPPSRPYKPSKKVNAVLGLTGGGLFGLVFVVLKERADKSIHLPGEAALYLDVPELGVIPSAAAGRSSAFSYYGRFLDSETWKQEEEEHRNIPVELTTWKNPSVMGDFVRSTLASILYSGKNGSRPRAIAFTSAGPQEGKTTVASNLALALAEIGKRVLLIDGDLRKPRLHDLFRVSNEWGFSDVLAGNKPPDGSEAMVFGTEYGGLHVLPAGHCHASISNLLHSPGTSEFLQRMRREFDMVLIDTPPILPMPDARVLGRLVDGVILVVRAERTTKQTAAAASQRLMDDGTRVLGTVLNEWDPRKQKFGPYDTAGRCVTAMPIGSSESKAANVG